MSQEKFLSRILTFVFLLLTFSVVRAEAQITVSCTLPAAQVGVAYSGTCSANGGTPAYTYGISQGALPTGLMLDMNAGTITGNPSASGNAFSFTVTATDSTMATGAFIDNSFVVAPGTVTLNCTFPATAQVNVPYTGASCSAGGGTTPYSYSLVGAPAWMSISATTGAISGTPATSGTYSFTVKVTDSETPAVSTTFPVATFMVAPAPLTLSCTFPATAQVNVAYTGASCSAGGGTPAYTYSLVGAPAWMSISATTGAISGTPTAATTTSFTVKVTDSASVTQTYTETTFVVAPATLTLSCTFPATAQVNVAYTGASCSAGGGTTPYTYSLVGAPAWMSISATTGAISGTPTAAATTSFMVKVTDSETPTVSTTFAVPSFVVAPAGLTLSCTFPATAQVNVAYTGASCSAGGGTTPYTYSLVGAPAWMSISATTGAISGTPTAAATTSFTVKVTDSETPTVSTTFAVPSFVVAPATLTLNCTFPATAQVNVAYTGASCTAGGGTMPYTYSLVGAPAWMSISGTTGAISGTPTTSGTYSFTVKVTDSETPAVSTTFAVPTFVVAPATLTLSCTFPATAQVNVAYTGASCTAGGGAPAYTYSLVGAPAWMSISATTGAISGTPTTSGTYSFTVKVTDSETPAVSTTFAVPSLVVAPATLRLNCTFPATAQVNVAYTGASCTAGGGTTPYTYSLVGAPAWMSISATTGAISGTPTTSGTYSFSVKVTDSETPAVSTTFAVPAFVVAPATLTLSCTFPATAQVNVAYAGASCSAGGGTPAYTYSLVGAPAWMSISGTTGAISGTPTASGTYSFSVKVTDSETPAVSTTFAVPAFVVAPPPLTLSCTFPATAQVNVAYTGASCSAGGGTPAYTYALVGAPAWMSISATTGAISGTPTTATTTSFTVKVTDSASVTQTYAETTFVVAPAALTLSCTFPAGAQVNVPYTGASCTAGGGTPAYTYSLVGAPAWMSIGAATGAISGTPTTASTTSFSVKVTDSASVTQTYTVATFVVVPPALTLTCIFPTPAQVNVAYTGASCTAGGGTPQYAYSLVNAPSWMAISSSGVISGTPTTATTVSFSVKVVDSSPTPQTQTYAENNFVIAPPGLVLTCAFPATARVNVAYTGASCSASGGTQPYSYSLVNGPSWMSINSSGVISGTPTSSGTISFSVKVVDSSPTQQTQTYAENNFVVAPPTLTLTCNLPATAQVGVAYTGASCTAGGGTQGYTYSLVSAPTWMSIGSTSGTISGTPPTSGTISFTVEVTDSASVTQTYPVASFVIAPAALTLSCTIPGGAQVNVPYTGAGCAGSGGTPAYAYVLVGAPSWMSIGSITGAISGTPTATSAGTVSFSVKVTDSGSPQLTATYAVPSFTVLPASAPVVPTFTFVGLPSSSNPAVPGVDINSDSLSLTTSSMAWPIAIALNFTPNAVVVGWPAGSAETQFGFVNTSGSTTTYSTTDNLTVPALASVMALPAILPGTVAGTVEATLTVYGQAGTSASFVVPASAPIITPGSVQVTNLSSTGFDVEVIANSSTRDLQTATFTFAAASGTVLNGTTTFSVNVSSVMSAWYTGTTSQQYGSQFMLTVPFTFSGSASAIGSVSVTLTNSVGTSAASSGTI